MEFNYSYKGSTGVTESGGNTQMSFSPDTKRPPTYFIGELRQNVSFREAISALHDVVVSDMRFKPKDKTAYKEWVAGQQEIDWQIVASQRQELANKIQPLQAELEGLTKQSFQRLAPFYKAKQQYFNYLYKKDIDAWFVLDPVITVHPDEVFFECFSQDESSYGRLSASYEVFQNISEFGCGTTNIDYSAALYDEFQKIRSYKTTSLQVDPSGFEVQTVNEETFKEVKIDLPDSWVRGFLQVSSAMSLPAVQFDLHPMDIHNICFVLRRHKEKQGPRSMRYILKPGEPVRVIFDPWGTEVVCARSIYTGSQEQQIRVWGRRRIHILERLIPVAKKFTVHLLGTGMPSFYVAD
ncbi:MAG: SWIM zinc finger family protein, partial [Microcoleus sp.]